MLSLVRAGPTIISISTQHGKDTLVDYIESISLSASHNITESYDHAGEGDTLVIFNKDDPQSMAIYQTSTATSHILCEIINRGLADNARKIIVAPPHILMRILGNLDAAIDQIARDFKAAETSKADFVANLDQPSVLVNFTSEPLNKVVPFSLFYKRSLLIGKPYGLLLSFLRAKAQEYLNIGLGKPDWNEIEITLFDSMDQFNLHYKRLITVLQGLDVGVIMGEDWVAEFTVGLRKSEVYQIRLLTPLSPREIKRIALALEYDLEGRRLVDFDVYANKKKIGWSTERQLTKGYTRDEIGILHRRRLMSSLPAEAKAMLMKLDAEIDRSGRRP